MRTDLRNITISRLITALQTIQEGYGDLPVCSDGNEADTATIYLTPITENSTEPRGDEKATKLFLDIY